MLENQTESPPSLKPGQADNSGGIKQPWFCVALTPSTTIFKGGCASSSEFAPQIKGASIAWIDYVTEDFTNEAVNAAVQLGFNPQLVTSLNQQFATYQDFDTEMGIRLPSVQVSLFDVEIHPLMVLINKNYIFTIHSISVDQRFIKFRRYCETVLKKIPADVPSEDRITMLLLRLVDENNARNFEHLREIEQRGDSLNESMMDPYTPRTELAPAIYHMKHALIKYLDALWDTVNVIHTLRYGDAELLTSDVKLLDKIGLLADDVNRQIGLAEHMSEVLASGLEVLQSIYNNQLQDLNNRLALVITYLTIIGTAILVPNTMATILSNGVFNLTPADMWWYAPMMILATILSAAGAWVWIKKQGWMPGKMDHGKPLKKDKNK